jgi:hypothetical protein
LWDVEALTFSRQSRSRMAVRLPALRAGHLQLREDSSYSCLLEAESTSRPSSTGRGSSIEQSSYVMETFRRVA